MKKIIAAVMLMLLCFNISALGGNDEVTRIEFIAGIMKELKLENTSSRVELADLDPNAPDYDLAAAAVHSGIVAGYGGNSIRPYAAIKREDALVLLCRAFNVKPVAELYLAGVADRAEISGYARGAAAAVVHNNIIEYNGRLCPKGLITSAEAEQMLRAFKKHSKKRLSFSYGYPALMPEARYGSIAVSLKTTLPCDVYYKLIPSDERKDNQLPEKREIDRFLTSIAIADAVVDAHIIPEDNREYDLFVMAVGKDGVQNAMVVLSRVRAHAYTIGNGTRENPYRIYNEEQLKCIKYHPESYFRLENDINLTQDWKPIEISMGERHGFAGELDGNYHKITNLCIDDNRDNTGFFRVIEGGMVKRLYLDATVYGVQGVGIITGRNAGGRIEECVVTGRVYADGNNAGAIAGINEGSIENSVAAAYMLEAAGYAGGIVGSNRGGRLTNNLSAVYSVSADMYASGIAGVNIDGVIAGNVCANYHSDDIITVKNGRITTNKGSGSCENNYSYDKMLSDTEVIFGGDTHDGLEVSWQELTSAEFYRDTMGWNTDDIWSGGMDTDFRLPFPKGFGSIDMAEGITMYAPIKISEKAELVQVKDEPNMHYILTDNIDLGGIIWEMIAENGTAEEGFGGTFDGNNFTISNMHLEPKTSGTNYGMFGVISNGTVRNLNLNNLTIEGESLAGGIAAENYGYIENCSVSGKIYALRKDNMLSVGGICGNNYGFIENAESDMKIRADGQVLTIGGIVANNEGFVNNTKFTGVLNAELSAEHSNAVAGGICGINIDGMIYNSYAVPQILAKASINYVGGIVGIANSGEVYKTAAEGDAAIYSRAYLGATAYAGGIAGLAPNGLIMNSMSGMNISAESNTAYIGGIVGYNMQASVQNTYSTSNIDVMGKKSSLKADCFVGGICGLAEGGFIADSVAVNDSIMSNGVAAAVGNFSSELAVYSNNYSAEEIQMNGIRGVCSNNGEIKPKDSIRTDSFFFKPIAEGGVLGWVKGDIWYNRDGHKLPLLWGVN